MTGTTCSLSVVEENFGVADLDEWRSASGKCATRVSTVVYIERRTEVVVACALSDVETLFVFQQVVGTISLTALHVASIILVGIPYIVPKSIVGTVLRVVVHSALTGIAVVCPTHTREGEGAVEARVTVHERIVAVVFK